MRFSRNAKNLILLFLVGGVLGVLPLIEAFSKPSTGLAAGGLDGSVGRVQPVSMPARISRVAYDPSTGGNEMWAIGQMRVPSKPEWGVGNGGEQIVFLHYRRGRGWDLFGPPVDEAGNIANPNIANMAFAPNGEAWAVGADGAMIHHPPGGGWTYRRECGPGRALPADSCTNLVGVSLRQGPGSTIGYAVGAPRNSSGASVSTILALRDGNWALDSKLAPASPVDFLAVAATSDDEAWAVGGASSRELQIWRRTGIDVAWKREHTGRPIFDQPAPSSDGSDVNLTALGTAVAQGPDGVVWIAGGINPVDPSDAFETFPLPFTLRWQNGTFTDAYCPQQYALSNDQLEATFICDPNRPMPAGPHDLTSLSVTPSGDVFAGGLGLYHFKDGAWFREPNPIGYLSSVAFLNASEGWFAATGNTIGGIGTVSSASSDSPTIAHYAPKSALEKPRVSRWPQYNTDVLHGVDVAPDGKRALAVGNKGTAVLYRPNVGWDRIAQVGISSLKAVAWSGPNEAWAVGERGMLAKYDGKTFRAVQDMGNVTLFGIAFRGGLGYAVGSNGTILVYQNGSWRHDPSSGMVSQTLFDVDIAGSTAYAVGNDSTLLVNSGGPGSWQRSSEIAEAVKRDDLPMYTVSGTPNGTVVVGGARKTVLRKGPGEAFSSAGDPIDGEGSVLDVTAVGDGAGMRLYASVSPFVPKPDKSRAPKGYLMYFDGTRWRDLDFTARTSASIAPQLETGASRDPIYSIAVEPDGSRGWAVGGLSEGVNNGNGNYNVISTSSVYRFDLGGDPDPPNSRVAPILSRKAAFSFAFLAETGCGIGPCSVTVGSGTAADEVALAIQDEINRLAGAGGGPQFNVIGGGLRSTGIPDELEQMRGYLLDYDKPVFAAIAPRDLYSPAGGGAVGLVPQLPPEYEKVVPIGPGTIKQGAATNRFFLRAFRDMNAPWGEGALPRGFSRVQIGASPRSGLARTHYAFDYAPAGKPIARFAFIDTSDFNYQKTLQGTQSQNPQQDQGFWLPQVIADARAKDPPIPTFVVLSVPTLNPTAFATQQKTNTLVDSSYLESTVLGGGVSAVLGGHFRANASYYYPAEATEGLRVPFYVMGGGGAPLEGTKFPSDGHFHAWHLIEVDPSRVSLLNPQADINVRTFPVIESVALHAIDGLHAPGGTALSFSALARAVDGGGPPGDPEQIRRTYINFPLSQYCPKIGPDRGGCMAAGALRSDYHFISEDPKIAQFVKQGFGPGLPLVENGFLIADDQSGFLCTFKAGSTHVKIISGTHQHRMPITVGAGQGPCVKYPVLDPQDPPIKRIGVVAGQFNPESPITQQPHRSIFKPPIFPDPLAIVLPPAPGPIAAPAPPGSAATSRKEEEEHQSQSEGQEGDGAQMRAMYHGQRKQNFDPLMGWLTLATVFFMGIAGAVGASSLSRRRLEPNYVEERRH